MDVRRRTAPVLGAVLWVACVQYLIVEQVAALGWSGAYSMRRNWISDLGAVSLSPWHTLMNASFVVQGLLIVFGAILVRTFFPPRRLFTIAFFLVSLSGIGLSCVGAFPEDVNARLHFSAAAEHFLTDNVGMILFGIALHRGPRSQLASVGAALSLLAGALGLIATTLTSNPTLQTWGVGIVERVAAYPFVLWLIGTGIVVLRSSFDLRSRATP